MDVTKYLLTVGFVGGILTDKMTFVSGIMLLVIAVVVFMIGFYAIPPREER